MNESSLMVRHIEPEQRRRRRRLMGSSAAPSPSSSSTTTSNKNSSSSNSNSSSSDSNSSSISPSPSSSSSSSSSLFSVQSDTSNATPPKSSSSSSPTPSKSPPPPPSSSSSAPPPQSSSPPPPSPKSKSSPPPPPSPDSDQSPPPESSESPQPPPPPPNQSGSVQTSSNSGSYSPPPPVNTPSSSTSSSSNDSPSPPPPPIASSQSPTNATPNTSNTPSPTSSTSSSSSSSNSNSNSNSTPTSPSTNNGTAYSNGTSNSTPTSTSTNNGTSYSSSNETSNSTPTTSSSSNGTASPSNETSSSTPASSSSTPASSSSTPASSSPSPSPNNPHTGAVRGAIVGAVAGVLIILLLGTLFLFIKRKRKRLGHQANSYQPHPNFYIPPDQTNYYGQTMVFSGEYGYPPHSFGSQQGGSMYYHGGGGEIGGSKSVFSYEELMEITNGFSRQNIIGEGGFGCVFRGQLHDGRAVAVKQLKAGSGQGEREFRAEVDIISRVHHRHLVSLVGYCISEHRRLLIYEFVPNKTLEHHLHGNGMPVLEWTKRLKIALGSAKGLAYLHEDCHPKIIHRDIKSANILLDDVFEAQVADFGLAKLTNDAHTHVSTRVMGTFGYLAPEYASSGKLTDRSDVFSFGVVLLELLTGRKPVDSSQPLGDESLVEWARPRLVDALESGDFSELVDPRLGKSYVESELIRMMEAAAACIRHSAPKRPRMAQVVRALDCDEELSDLSNGVKYGQSMMYNSDQYSQDIMRFRRMADGNDDSMEYESTASKSSSINNQTSSKSSESSIGTVKTHGREIEP